MKPMVIRRLFLITMVATTLAAVPIGLAAGYFDWSTSTILAVSTVVLTPICLWTLRLVYRELDAQERRHARG